MCEYTLKKLDHLMIANWVYFCHIHKATRTWEKTIDLIILIIISALFLPFSDHLRNALRVKLSHHLHL